MKRLLLAVLLLSVLVFGLPVAAQDGGNVPTFIEYGAIVEGEITNQEFEVEYSFAGTAGDVIIVEMARVEGSDLENPALLILNADFEVLTSREGYDSVAVIYELPADGQYFLLASRSDGRAGTSTGAYELTLLSPPELLAGQPLEASTSRESNEFFVIRTTENFSLRYTHNDGVFAPRINVAIVHAESGSMEVIAAMEGSKLGSGQLNIDTTDLDAAMYIVYTSHSSLYEYYEGEALADFTLEFVAP